MYGNVKIHRKPIILGKSIPGRTYDTTYLINRKMPVLVIEKVSLNVLSIVRHTYLYHVMNGRVLLVTWMGHEAQERRHEGREKREVWNSI